MEIHEQRPQNVPIRPGGLLKELIPPSARLAMRAMRSWYQGDAVASRTDRLAEVGEPPSASLVGPSLHHFGQAIPPNARGSTGRRPDGWDADASSPDESEARATGRGGTHGDE